MSDLIRQLFLDYCHYRRQTAHFQQLRNRGVRLRDPKFSEAHRGALEGMERWCRGKLIPPRQWLYYLFARRRWLYPLACDRGNLCSEKAFSGYSGWKEYSAFQKRLQETTNAAEAVGLEHSWDPNRDLNRGVEMLKESFVARGQIDRCLVGIHSQTYGYHPRSHICTRCPGQAACAQTLARSVNFDILALRRGEITSAQAQNTARMGANRYAY